MNLSRPYDAVLPGAEGDVLRVLAKSSRPFTGREVARLAGRAHTTVQRSLDQFADRGLVDKATAGRAYLYSLNRDHLAAPAVEDLAGLRQALIERLRDAISEWDPAPLHASLFGSAARGDGSVDSDIDLLLVRPPEVATDERHWQAQVDALVDHVERWTGNRAAVLDLSEMDIAQMASERPAIVDELRADAVTLAGADTRALLRS